MGDALNSNSASVKVMMTAAGFPGLVLIALGAALEPFPYLALVGMPAMAAGIGVSLVTFCRQFTRTTRFGTLLIFLLIGSSAVLFISVPIELFFLALPAVAAAVGVSLIVFSRRFGRFIPVGALLILFGSMVVLCGAMLTPQVFFTDPHSHNPSGFSLYAMLDRDHSVFLPIFWVLGPGLVTFGVKFCSTWSSGKLIGVFSTLLAIFPLTMLAFQFLLGIWPLND